MKDHLMKVLYVILGVLVCAVVGLHFLSGMYETHQAYKFPSRTVTKKEVKTVYEKVKEKTDIIAIGNARVETRPDGTQIVTADRIELHVQKDSATSTATTSTSMEADKPVFQEDRKWLGQALTTLDGQTQQLAVTYFIFKDIGITASEQFSLSKVDVKIDAAHTFVGVAVKF